VAGWTIACVAVLGAAGCGEPSTTSTAPGRPVAGPTSTAGGPATSGAPGSAVVGAGPALADDPCSIVADAAVVRFTAALAGPGVTLVDERDDQAHADCEWRLTGPSGAELALELFLYGPTDEIACGFTGTDAPAPLAGVGVPAYTFDASLATASTPSACIAFQRGGPRPIDPSAVRPAWAALLAQAVDAAAGDA
jgi:hypothetical protein